MKDKLGMTKDSIFKEAQLAMDLAEIHYNEWKHKDTDRVPFDKLSAEERMRIYFSCMAIVKALREAGLLTKEDGDGKNTWNDE